MIFISSVANRVISIITILLILFPGLLNAQVKVIQPVEDVFIYTFGGGQGANVFLKYDISSVPGSMIIDSVLLTPFVWKIGTNWDGDANYWNVNNQNWTESDSARLIWGLPTSDSTHQASGFGTATGWTKSVELKNVFSTDYNAGNTFCSIKIKDPDDPTFMPMPGSYPVDSNDTLTLGNILDTAYIFLYPHEYPNGPPWLNVYYHETGINEGQVDTNRPSLQVYPNPFNNKTAIKFETRNPKSETNSKLQNFKFQTILYVYDVTGRLAKQFGQLTNFSFDPEGLRTEGQSPINQVVWDGRDESGQLVPDGIYFCKLRTGEYTIIKKVCLIR